MREIYGYLAELNAASVCFRLALAVLLGRMIGAEREHRGKAAGLRTHIFVALGAAMSAMLGVYISEVYGSAADVTRMSAQVISGIGFLGAGTILVRHRSFITGLTTAACIWTTGIIGLAVGYGFYEPAIVCAAVMPIIAGGRARRGSAQSPRLEGGDHAESETACQCVSLGVRSSALGRSQRRCLRRCPRRRRTAHCRSQRWQSSFRARCLPPSRRVSVKRTSIPCGSSATEKKHRHTARQSSAVSVSKYSAARSAAER